MLTRRKFAKLGLTTLAGLPLASSLPLSAMMASAKISSKIHGVDIGLESYGLMPYPQEGVIDLLISTMVKMGIGNCNLQEFLLIPPDVRILVDKSGGPDRQGVPNTPEFQAIIKVAEDALADWRKNVSLDSLRAVRKKFDGAGINLYGYMPNNLRTVANSTDEDLNRACEITQALGIGYMAVMMPKSAARRFVPIAEKYKMKVGIHGHPNMNSTNPDIISTPADYIEAAGLSKNYAIHFDIGNATGGGYDVVSFIKENHGIFSSLAVKDRTKNRVSKPWGEGDSHVKEVLQLIRDNKYPIHCLIDCDFQTAPGSTRIDDINRCFDYAKNALSS